MSICRFVVLAAIVLMVSAPPSARATPFAYRPDGQIIDTATDTITGSVSGIINITGGVAMNSAGTRVYMVDTGFLGGNGLKVINTATNSSIATISAVSHLSPVAIHPSGAWVYTHTGSNLQIIDAATNTVVNSVFVGPNTQGLAVHPDGSRVYALTREPSGGSPSSVAVVDTATVTVLARVPIAAAEPHGIAIHPSGTRVYAAAFDNGAAGGVYVIDTATNAVLQKVGTNANHLAVNPAGTRLYVGGILSGIVYVVDLTTNTVVANVSVAALAYGIAVNPAGTKVYVLQNGNAGTLIIDAATNTAITTVPGFTNASGAGLFIGPYCPGACSDGNPCTTDVCNPVGGCTYTNNTAPCANDGNPCTDDVCDGAGGCGHPPLPAMTPCPDGLFCNGSDTCDASGTCLHTGDPCSAGSECADACDEANDDCFDAPGSGCTDDGNPCTDDQCDGAGACGHPANSAPCDDGFFCTLTDVCAGGICGGTGDPCQGGPECADDCNEASDDCFDPGGTSCTPDANPCTLDQCDGAGSCAHPSGNGGAVCRSAVGQCDATETCTGTSAACPPDGGLPDGTGCNDGDACTNPDACTAGVCTSGAAVVCALCETCDTSGGCIEAPRSGCKQPTKPLKASIQLMDRTPDDLDQVKWKWTNGQATTFAELGDPLATDDYALCVYDASSSLLLRMTAPAGGICGTKPCWKQLGPSTLPKGYKYKDLDGLPHDLDTMTIKAGLEGKAKVSLKGKGTNIPMPALGAFALPLTTQLQSGNGQCYEATTTTPSANTATLFKAKAD